MKDDLRRDCGAGRAGFGHFVQCIEPKPQNSCTRRKIGTCFAPHNCARRPEFPVPNAFFSTFFFFVTSLFAVCRRISPINLQRQTAEGSSFNMSHLLSCACRIYPLTHPSIRLLNEACQYFFPFLLLQLLSLTSVIYDAFGFTAYVIGMHEKQALAYFSRIEF